MSQRRMNRIGALFYLLLFTGAASAFDHRHSAYGRLLGSVVHIDGQQSRVDYVLLKQQGDLADYLAEIESVTREAYRGWPQEQQIAFLINAYNAFTLKLIIDNYPGIKSIRDLGGLVFGSPWKKKFFTLFGAPSHLDHIEHDILRRDFREPRIHFALVCAARGCPPLQPRAYVGERLDEQLDAAARNFLTDPARNRYLVERKKLELSSIFDWFRDDFISAAGSVQAYVAPYISDDPEIQVLLHNKAASIRYLDYDWTLNDIDR